MLFLKVQLFAGHKKCGPKASRGPNSVPVEEIAIHRVMLSSLDFGWRFGVIPTMRQRYTSSVQVVHYTSETN